MFCVSVVYEGGCCLKLQSCKILKIQTVSPSKYKPKTSKCKKTLFEITTPNISPLGLVLGNCPQIQNKTFSKNGTVTKIFVFAKELLRVPNDCSQKVLQFIAVCVVLFILSFEFPSPCRQSSCITAFYKGLPPQSEFL